MKKIKAKVKFKDMKHGNMLRYIGDVFIEDNARADDLIARGFVTLVEEIKEKAEPKKVEKAVETIEVAVKEEKKEKAVKEKAVKKNAKK